MTCEFSTILGLSDYGGSFRTLFLWVRYDNVIRVGDLSGTAIMLADLEEGGCPSKRILR